MKLHAFRITQYRSLSKSDPRWVGVADVTCLVGKNEAGKSNVLRALERLNPADTTRPPLSVVSDFPRDRQGGVWTRWRLAPRRGRWLPASS